MRTKVVKKNNPELLKRRGKGFYGRVLAIMFDSDFLVVQNIKGMPKSHAVVRYCDFTFTDDEINKLQQVYLNRYKTELLRIVSVQEFVGSQPFNNQFERFLEPIGKQKELDLNIACTQESSKMAAVPQSKVPSRRRMSSALPTAQERTLCLFPQ